MIETRIRGDTGERAERAGTPVNWQRFLGRRRSTFMSREDRSYFEQRAAAEIARAQAANHPEAMRSHYLLAGYYLDLVHCGAADGDEGEASRLPDDGAPEGRADLIAGLCRALGRVPEEWETCPRELLLLV